MNLGKELILNNVSIIYVNVNASVSDCWVVLLSSHSDSDSLGQHKPYGLPINPLDMESHGQIYKLK